MSDRTSICARCGTLRKNVRPDRPGRLCRDCRSVLTMPEREKWNA